MGDIFRRKRTGHAWETAVDEGTPESGEVFPVAIDDATVDDTTYPDVQYGTGNLRTLILENDFGSDGITALAVAVDGDAFPRLLCTFYTDGSVYLIMGNGVLDTVNDGCYIGFLDGGDDLSHIDLGAQSVKLNSGSIFVNPALPTTDPHFAGQVWVDPISNILKMSTG